MVFLFFLCLSLSDEEVADEDGLVDGAFLDDDAFLEFFAFFSLSFLSFDGFSFFSVSFLFVLLLDLDVCLSDLDLDLFLG